MFNGMDLNQILDKAKELQKNMQKERERAADETVEAQVGGGMVKVVMNGKLEVLKLEIDQEVLKSEDKDTLEDLLRAGVNEAIRQAKELTAGGMNEMFSGMQMPDLSKFDFSQFLKK